MLLVEYLFFDKRESLLFYFIFVYFRKSKEEYDQEEERKRKKQVPIKHTNIVEVFHCYYPLSSHLGFLLKFKLR